jgi:ketosteroid isomerase-like protein
MKAILTFSLAILSLVVMAQGNVQPMVAAERNFAAASLEKGTRDAFLEFMDTSAIMFQKGEFGKSYANWQAREKGQGVLDWQPVVAEVSASGTWGFTTGPWTFRNNAHEDTLSGRGHFFTIWHKVADGSWKFIFDCGIDGGKETLNTLYPFLVDKRAGGDPQALTQADQDFSGKLAKNARQAHVSYMSVTSVVCREGGFYAITPGQQARWLKALPATIEARSVGQIISPAKDLALVYGTITIAGKPQAFVRLWRNEPGGWRLAAELLPL